MHQQTTPNSNTKSALPYLVLIGGVLAVASASILIRLAQNLGVPSTTIAAGRLGLAALFLLPFALLHAWADVRTLHRHDLLLAGAAGVVLSIHFLSWISSLEYTSVASSAALVSTNPLWVALASVLLFRERLGVSTWVGVLLTIGGSTLIGFSDGSGGNAKNALLGDGLALMGAFAGSIYFLIGRELRRRLSTLAYIWLVYTGAAIVLLTVALIVGWGSSHVTTLQTQILGFPPMVYVLLLGLAMGPQLLGHTSFNWSLRYLSATFVAVAILGEPIGSALLALLIFGEQFAPIQLLGFTLLLVGIAVAARAERKVPVSADTPTVMKPSNDQLDVVRQ